MSEDYNFTNNIPNAWMASEPGHIFWKFCIDEMIHSLASYSGEKKDEVLYVENTTGPAVLFRAVRKYQAACKGRVWRQGLGRV